MPTQSKILNANPAKKGLPGRRPGEPGTIVPVEGPAPSTRGVIPSEARNLSSRAAGSDANRREIPRAATTGPRDDSESDDRRQDAGATPDSSSPYGPNNEQLPDRLQEALRRLVFQFSTEPLPARPFMRPSLEENAEKIRASLQEAVREAIENG
jgi:hypothetical protein